MPSKALQKRIVSIQHLFLFNGITAPLSLIVRCFNTASVLIQRISFFCKLGNILRFNTASVLIQRMEKRKRCGKRFVSIQHLFLFNANRFSVVGQTGAFQYSICSYSTAEGKTSTSIFTSFNTASVLIQPLGQSHPSVNNMFQYSICSYSTTR